jgi:hypothetical protein
MSGHETQGAACTVLNLMTGPNRSNPTGTSAFFDGDGNRFKCARTLTITYPSCGLNLTIETVDQGTQLFVAH